MTQFLEPCPNIPKVNVSICSLKRISYIKINSTQSNINLYCLGIGDFKYPITMVLVARFQLKGCGIYTANSAILDLSMHCHTV